MKAYVVGLYSDSDAGQEIVFAETAKNAKEKASKLDISEEAESFIDLYAKRCADFDGMENASAESVLLKQFREGWCFFGFGQPNCESATDEEFLKWYRGLN
ncbi:TPA_asm: hypothetical protein GEU45_05885 [Listeria monocytogenes]|nr:hypothetical protein [Listeria monocytogenes]